MSQVNAPFVALYDLLRTALYNKKYYGARIASLSFWTKAYDILLALAGSAVVVSLFPQVLNLDPATAKTLTQWTAFVAAAGGIARPFLGLEETASRIGQQSVHYGMLYDDAWALTKAVDGAPTMLPDAQSEIDLLDERHKTIRVNDDKHPSRRLRKQCQRETLERHPEGSLWLPEPLPPAP